MTEAGIQPRVRRLASEVAQMLLRATVVCLAVLVSFAVYALVIHPFVPTILPLDALAGRISSIQGMSTIVHSRVAYFFFLAPWVAGYAQARWRFQLQPGDLLLAWLGSWISFALSVWIITSYEPFAGYRLALPLWEAPGTLPMLVPTAAYFMVLAVTSLGAAAFTRSTGAALATLGATLAFLLIGMTWDDWQWVRRAEAARAITSESRPDLQELGKACLAGHPSVRQVALIRLGMELRAHPEQADAVLPTFAALLGRDDVLELQRLALRILKGDEIWMVPGQAMERRERGGIPFPQVLRQRRDVAVLLKRAADDSRWDPVFRVDLRRALAQSRGE